MRHKNQKVLIHEIVHRSEPVHFRVVIEGTRYGSPLTVKRDVMADIREAAESLNGAAVVKVTTIREVRAGVGIHGARRVGLSTERGPVRRVKRSKREVPADLPLGEGTKAGRRAFRLKARRERTTTSPRSEPSQNGQPPKSKAANGPRAYWARLSPAERTAQALRRASTKNNWSPEELVRRLREKGPEVLAAAVQSFLPSRK